MHEVVGEQQHQGRIALGTLMKKPGFVGVAALEGLRGEVTILDGEVVVTEVTPAGRLAPAKAPRERQAALLVGAYVEGWRQQALPGPVAADRFDDAVEAAAKAAGIPTDRPFPFIIEGEFTDVRFHVINGACPIRARMKKETLPADKAPFEGELQRVSGKVVGVFAKDAVGKITHPATKTHAHLLYRDPEGNRWLTGHLEKVAVGGQARIRFPQAIARQ
jgi:alpha-acetolactate decarboxylase